MKTMRPPHRDRPAYVYIWRTDDVSAEEQANWSDSSHSAAAALHTRDAPDSSVHITSALRPQGIWQYRPIGAELNVAPECSSLVQRCRYVRCKNVHCCPGRSAQTHHTVLIPLMRTAELQTHSANSSRGPTSQSRNNLTLCACAPVAW